MKNQEKTKKQTPKSGTETTKTTPQTQQDQQRGKQGEQNETSLNPGIEKKHNVGDIEDPNPNKNQGSDVKKIKDPDPTIPERRNDPVAGKNDDYSRTRNTPGKSESNSVGEFTEIDELDRADDDESETSDISDEERDEEEPGSFDPEGDQKEAFGGDKKNSVSPDERKNKNGL